MNRIRESNFTQQPEFATITNHDGGALACGGEGKPLQNLNGFMHAADFNVDGRMAARAAAEAIGEVRERVEKCLRVSEIGREDAFVLRGAEDLDGVCGGGG